MPTQTDRCPLCGSVGITNDHTARENEYCLNPDCNLAVRQWPHVALLGRKAAAWDEIPDDTLDDGEVDSLIASVKQRDEEWARLVAIRDAAVAWEKSMGNGNMWDAAVNVLRLARQEAAHDKTTD